MPHLLALMGPADSGKSTLAGQLVKWKHFRKIGFADGLKGMLSHFLTSQGLDSVLIDRMLKGDLKDQPSEYFYGHTPRYAMQTLGTEWRNMIGRNLWLDAWAREVQLSNSNTDINIVADDLRFSHEANRVRSLGGKIVLIRRTGRFAGAHLSEREWLDIRPDLELWNNGPREKMYRELFHNMPELEFSVR